MNKDRRNLVIGIGVVLLLFGALVFASSQEDKADQESLLVFAECLNESGAVMYGAFWCPHCQEQKEAFGSAEDSFTYIECSLPDGSGQKTECATAGITNYPTWEFSDGSRLTGAQTIDTLSEKTQCPL